MAWVVRSWVLSAVMLGCASDEPRPPPTDAGLDSAAPTCAGRVEELKVTSALHVAGPVDYPDPPPVGGPHNQCWASWGVYEEALRPERWVHNLEHGGVVLLYHCPDGCDDELTELRAFAEAHTRTILTPYAGFADLTKNQFAAVAWEHRLVGECLEIAAFQQFYDAWFDRGPESIADGPPTVCLERPEL